MANTIAILPGSFDPITVGHQDLVERATKFCDKLYIGVSQAHHKNPLLPLDERAELIRSTLPDLKLFCPVSVVTYHSLLIDLCIKLGANNIIRGIRNGRDTTYEVHLANINRHLNANIDTILLPTRPEFSFISSTVVREIAKLGGNISLLVHPKVEERLLKFVRIN